LLLLLLPPLLLLLLLLQTCCPRRLVRVATRRLLSACMKWRDCLGMLLMGGRRTELQLFDNVC
jgi:hypothetical protein